MKLVMIHGISQENTDQTALLSLWSGLLTEKKPDLLNNVDVEMAYYGKELAKWTSGEQTAAVAMGVGTDGFDPTDQDEMKFLLKALGEAAEGNNLSDAEIEAAAQEADIAVGADAVPMSTWMGRKIVGIVRALEKLSPAKGAIALRVVKQAYTYLSKPGAGPAIDKLVRPRLEGEKLVVLSHSLGTVVAFKLLRKLATEQNDIHVPLLITLGSPLALEAVKSKLGPPRMKPPLVEKWINFFDPGDPVTLGKALSAENFAPGIENVGDVDNATPNAHSIGGYLPDSRVIEALRSAFNED